MGTNIVSEMRKQTFDSWSMKNTHASLSEYNICEPRFQLVNDHTNCIARLNRELKKRNDRFVALLSVSRF